MRTSLTLLLLGLLSVSTLADKFSKQKLKIGKKTCTCTLTLEGVGSKATGKGNCDKKCSGTQKNMKLEGDSGVFTFNIKVTKGVVKITNGRFEAAAAATTTAMPPTGSGSGSVPPTGSGSGSVPPTGSGSGSMPPTGSGSGSMPPTGSGSGSMPPTGSGSGSAPPTGSGSGSESGEGMECSCKCDCPDGSGKCDCNCNCPMQSKNMTCAVGFTQVCPMTDGECPKEMEKKCPRGMEESRSIQNRMADSPAGCQCVPDFLISLVVGDAEMPSVRAAPVADVIKKKVKVGKKTCTCSFKLLAAGSKLNMKKSSGKCENKCTGSASKVKLEGDSGNIYTFNMKVKKGKVTFSGASVELAAVPTEAPPAPTPASGPACSCIDASKIGGMPGSGSSMPGSGSGSMPGSGSGSMPGSGSESGSSMPGSGSESGSGSSMPGSGSESGSGSSMPGSGSESGSESESGSGSSMPGSGSESGSGSSMPGSGSGSGSEAQKWLPWFLGMEPMELCVETGTEVIFNKTGHNVVQMATQADYDGCTGFLGENPTVGNNIDPFPWQAEMDGVYYFACGVGTHCSAGGMKAKITVAPTCAKNVTVPWSFGMEPQVLCVETGTTVIIDKTGSFHNVNMLATQSDYDDCTGFTDTVGNSDNPYIFQADMQGIYYFACGVGTHCKSGNMKAMITVADSCQ